MLQLGRYWIIYKRSFGGSWGIILMEIHKGTPLENLPIFLALSFGNFTKSFTFLPTIKGLSAFGTISKKRP